MGRGRRPVSCQTASALVEAVYLVATSSTQDFIIRSHTGLDWHRFARAGSDDGHALPAQRPVSGLGVCKALSLESTVVTRDRAVIVKSHSLNA